MKRDELKTAIDYYRTKVKEEMAGEKKINGQFIGPRNPTRKMDLEDIIHPKRPFLSKDVENDVDSIYVTTFRFGTLKKPVSMVKCGHGTDLVGGMEFGSQLVQKGFIKSVKDLAPVFAKYKLGILDIFMEKDVNNGKKMDIMVYECIECGGLPNIGEPVCYFETGIITGILKELTHKEVFAEEVRCWASGYSFCHFSVEINHDPEGSLESQ